MEANKGEFPKFRIQYVPPSAPSQLHDLPPGFGPRTPTTPFNPFVTEQAEFGRGRASRVRLEHVGQGGRVQRNLRDSLQLSAAWQALAGKSSGPWQVLHDATVHLGADGRPNLAALRQAQVRLHQWLRAQTEGKRLTPAMQEKAAQVDALVGRLMRRNTPFGELPATSALQAPPSNWAPLRQLVDKVLPTSADALHRKALKLWHAGQSAEALALLEAATERHPSNARLHLDMGRVLVDEGYYADAEWTLSQLAAEHPRHAEVHAALGDLFVQIGQPLLAIESFGQAVKFDPEHTDAHVHLGVAHYELGDLTSSAPHLQKAIRLDGKNVVARFFMAQISLQQNDVLRARYQLGMVAKLDPSVDLSRFGENAPPPLTSQTKPREAPLHHWQLPQARAAKTGHLNRRPGQTQSLND